MTVVMTRRRRARGGSVVARLLLVALVPMAATVHLGWRDMRREQRTVAAADELRELVEFEHRVAATAAPVFIEYLAHIGLATIDGMGVDRSLATELTGIDYEQVYLENMAALDLVLDELAVADGDVVLDDGRNFGTELARIEADLTLVRAATESRAGDPVVVGHLVADLESVLDRALRSARSMYDSSTIATDLKRFRAESTSLTWVLQTAGDSAQELLSAVIVPGPHELAVAEANAAHDQAVTQFAGLLPEETRTTLRLVTRAAPDALSFITSTAVRTARIDGTDGVVAFDPARARAASSLVLDEVDYLGYLGAWADTYYDDVTSTVAGRADDARSSLERTMVAMWAMVIIVFALVLMTARSMLRPLLRLGRRAAAIGRGELALDPLPVRGPSVLRSLTRTMNAMHETLQQVDRQAQALAAGRLDDACLAEPSPGQLGASISSSVERLARMTAQLQASEERSSAIVSCATVAIWTVDDQGRIASANATAERVLALPAAEQLGNDLSAWLRTVRGECEVARADGSHVWLDVEHTEVETSGGRLVTVLAEDITERREFERRLAHQARSDALTGLPNRFAVLERLAQLSDSGGSAAVLFIDVDGFKSVNDTRGHATGDQVLIDIANRLQSELRAGSMVARLGGDEFVVVATDLPDEHAVLRLGRRLIERVEQPYQFDDTLFGLSASVGVATMLPGDAPLDVIHRADAAVYHAKDLGRARVEVFDQEFQTRVEQRAQMEMAMRDAIGAGDVEMYLQPIFDLVEGRPVGAEALARWNRPGIGYVSPAEFVAVAENSSLIIDLTRSMLYAACERIAVWKRDDPACSLRLAVNLSGRHLIDGDLIGDLVEVLSVTGADPRLLELELTETQLLADLEPAREVLETVRAMGITVAVDDFGTGFSSMAYLRQLSVDVIKVDRSFVSGAGLDGFDATAIDAMVNFGRVLGVHVVAEGIETEAQLAFVKAHGCSRGQGFLLGRPLPIAETEATLFGRPLRHEGPLEATHAPTVTPDDVRLVR